MTLKNFAGAVAVITGGASGIGLATARALYAQGVHIVLADINALPQAEQQVRQSNSAATSQVMTVPTDVTDEQQVTALMQQTLAQFQRIDLVITCAGLGRGGPIDLFTGEEMRTLMDVNFMGTYHCIRAALPAMRQQESGHFVLLSSVAGKLCPPLLSAYSATKWAVRGLASTLRAELFGTGIGITTVYPGWVDTPMIRQEGLSALMSANAVLTTEQVASAILQAVQDDQPDLTLSADPDITLLLQVMEDDPTKAEQMAGKAFRKRLQQLQEQ